jgi:hypothetical protein
MDGDLVHMYISLNLTAAWVIVVVVVLSNFKSLSMNLAGYKLAWLGVEEEGSTSLLGENFHLLKRNGFQIPTLNYPLQ